MLKLVSNVPRHVYKRSFTLNIININLQLCIIQPAQGRHLFQFHCQARRYYQTLLMETEKRGDVQKQVADGDFLCRGSSHRPIRCYRDGLGSTTRHQTRCGGFQLVMGVPQNA